MSSNFVDRITEATRLTRAGKLGEATALIQRLLGGGAPETPAGPNAAAAALRLPDAFAAPQPAAPRLPDAIAGRPTTARPRRARLGETIRQLVERARAFEPPLAPEAAPLAPPVETPAGARFEAGRYADAFGARDYKLYVPAAAAAAGGSRPLVLMLHGCTQNPDDFARGTGMNAAAEAEGAIVLYPGQTQCANPKRCWNWFGAENQGRGAGEAALLAQMTREVIATENVDPARVYVAGLSAGGAQAMNLASHYPDIFAAVGVHSGLPSGAARDIPSAFAAMSQGAAGAPAAQPVRAIVFHGDADRTVNPANAAAVAAQAIAVAGPLELEFEQGEAGGRSYSRTVHRDRRGGALCESWTIHGAGHAWSGGDSSGSYADPTGPDATREMLRFFLRG